MANKAKRIGRPMKAPAPGKRAPLGLLVRPDLKEYVDRLARETGRTQSATAEALIEQGIAVADTLALSGSSVPEFSEQVLDAVMRRRGYRIMRGRNGGKSYISPDENVGSRSEWYPPVDPPEEQGQ